MTVFSSSVEFREFEMPFPNKMTYFPNKKRILNPYIILQSKWCFNSLYLLFVTSCLVTNLKCTIKLIQFLLSKHHKSNLTMVTSNITSPLIMIVTLYYLIAFRLQMFYVLICCHSLFCCSATINIGFLVLDQRWPSARDIVSTTSWTHLPTAS